MVILTAPSLREVVTMKRTTLFSSSLITVTGTPERGLWRRRPVLSSRIARSVSMMGVCTSTCVSLTTAGLYISVFLGPVVYILRGYRGEGFPTDYCYFPLSQSLYKKGTFAGIVRSQEVGLEKQEAGLIASLHNYS